MRKLELTLTDSVFVLGQGSGRVVKVLPDNGGYVVAVPGRGEMHYSVSGTAGAGRDRRLYYHDPVLVDPPKDRGLWRAYSDMSLAVYGKLYKLFLGGEVPDDGPDEPD